MLQFFRKIRKDFLLKKKIGNYILYALGEVLLIFVGVLLALYLQNKNESKRTNKKVQTTLSMIKKEMKVNKKVVASIAEYRQMLQDTLTILNKTELPNTDKKINDSFGFWKGLGSKRLLNSAFQTGIQTGLNTELSPELLGMLNELHNKTSKTLDNIQNPSF